METKGHQRKNKQEPAGKQTWSTCFLFHMSPRTQWQVEGSTMDTKEREGNVIITQQCLWINLIFFFFWPWPLEHQHSQECQSGVPPTRLIQILDIFEMGYGGLCGNNGASYDFPTCMYFAHIHPGCSPAHPTGHLNSSLPLLLSSLFAGTRENLRSSSLWVWHLSLNRITPSSDPFLVNGMISFFLNRKIERHCVCSPHCLHLSTGMPLGGFCVWTTVNRRATKYFS